MAGAQAGGSSGTNVGLPTNNFSIVATDAVKAEGNSGVTRFSFTVTRHSAASIAETAQWAVTGTSVSSANGGDFGGTLPAGNLTFEMGETVKTLTIDVTGDGIAETDEQFLVTLTGTTLVQVPPGVSTTAIGTIQNDDAGVSTTWSIVAMPDSQLNTIDRFEGTALGPNDFAAKPYMFEIARAGDVSRAGSITYSIVGSGANPANAADFDSFNPLSQTITFAAGQSTTYIQVNVLSDSLVEPDEQFSVILSNPTDGAGLDVASASAGIRNDDFAGFSVVALDAVKNEGNGGSTAFTFKVIRTGNASSTASVAWAVDGNVSGNPPATANDFLGAVSPSGTLQFAAGVTEQVIVVQVAGDFLVEDAYESFNVTLSNPSGSLSLLAAQAVGTIINDDSAGAVETGTAGNDTMNRSGQPQGVMIDASQGGNDTITGSALGDTFLLGTALTSKDKINGGGGNDRLVLNGNYSDGITLGSSTVTNVETIVLAGGNSYRITTNDATIAAGNKLTIDASALGAIDSATVNGTAEKSGGFIFLGGAGADSFTGGAGADSFTGGGGADAMKGNNGADIFRYLAASDSPLALSGSTIDTSAFDQIASFQAGTDKLDLHVFGFTGAAASVVTKTSTAFTATLAKATGFFGTAGVAVEYASSGRTVTTRVYVDANGDHNLGTGDAVIQLTGVSKNGLTTSSIMF